MKGLKVAGSIIIVLLVAIFAFTLTIDGIIKNKIERVGSSLLSTKVEVDDVDISIFDSQAEIDGFAIYNPDGFTAEKAISFEDIKLDLNIKSLLADTIIIEQIYVEDSEIFFEQRGTDINLKELSSNLSTGGTKSDSKSIVINSFILEETEIRILSDLEEEREVKGEVARIELNNIGKNGSNTMEEVMQQILEPVIERAVAESVKSGLLDKLQNAVDGLINN